jgi:hypothetical protein
MTQNKSIAKQLDCGVKSLLKADVAADNLINPMF